MAVNDATIRLITEFEGFVDRWYPDPAHGWKVPTVMYGHTDAAGPPKYADTKDKTFTKAEAIATLKQDLAGYENSVNKLVKVPLNANQYGALVSFTYNLGEGNLAKSTLLKKLNAGDYAGAAAEFEKWNRAAGKVLAGLTRRRKAEAQLFLSPAVTAPIPPAPMPPDFDPTEDPITTKPHGTPWWVFLLIIAAIVSVAVWFIFNVPVGS